MTLQEEVEALNQAVTNFGKVVVRELKLREFMEWLSRRLTR